ncbi:MAG: phospho-sugar mutase [Clostridia bacterium]
MINETYNRWLENTKNYPELQEELLSIKGKDDEIRDRFYRELEFGTAGLRGVIGAGAFRMNVFTIARATQGLAEYLNADFKNPSVAIAYDSRNKSDDFAKVAAAVLAANNIKVYIYKELMPTPCLSYAVRAHKASAGITVTASHNPAKYNGYKVYGADGCQMTSNAANKVLKCINNIDIFTGVKMIDFDKGVAKGEIEYIKSKVALDYLKAVAKQAIHKDILEKTDLKVVYTPLNGTGNKPVRKILEMRGLRDIIIVKEQEMPDGNFPTCPFPNPEIKEALAVGLEYCEREHPDLLIATDPDADRVGIAVPNGTGYRLMSGNETGALLFEYICSQRKALGTMPKNPVAVKTIVSTDLVTAIAKEYDVELRNVLTGFKYIGEQIGLLEEDGEENRYIFGFEESYGYLCGSYVRDKDAVVGSMMICEMTAYYKSKGITLVKALENLYEKYGNYCHTQESFVFEGESGMEKMSNIMKNLRYLRPTKIAGIDVVKFTDYMASKECNTFINETNDITLPKADVLSFLLRNNSSVILRPSGTEPKIKAYYTTKDVTMERAIKQADRLAADFTEIINNSI